MTNIAWGICPVRIVSTGYGQHQTLSTNEAQLNGIGLYARIRHSPLYTTHQL